MLEQSGEHSRQSRLTNDSDTRIALFLMGEPVTAQRANDPDALRGLLYEGIQELGATKVEQLLLDWLHSFLSLDEGTDRGAGDCS